MKTARSRSMCKGNNLRQLEDAISGWSFQDPTLMLWSYPSNLVLANAATKWSEIRMPEELRFWRSSFGHGKHHESLSKSEDWLRGSTMKLLCTEMLELTLWWSFNLCVFAFSAFSNGGKRSLVNSLFCPDRVIVPGVLSVKVRHVLSKLCCKESRNMCISRPVFGCCASCFVSHFIMSATPLFHFRQRSDALRSLGLE